MTDPVRSTDPDPWAGSLSKPTLPSDPVAARRQLEADAQARDRRKARLYGTYWAIVTALLCVAAVVGLASGDARGLLVLLLAGSTGLYSRYLYRGGRIRIFILPLP